MKILPFGDRAALINFEQRIDPTVNAKVIVLQRKLERGFFPEISFLIPAYCSLTIGFNSKKITFKKLQEKIEKALGNNDIEPNDTSKIIKIPVCYDLPYSIDFQEVINQTHLSKKEIIKFHTGQKFRIYMLGFLPGFPYLGKVPKKLFTKRKAIPRMNVPAGSVGLAGFQTGIYPSNSPGGWQIIGRTPVKVFDVLKKNPFLFQAGDFVEFFEISKEEFEAFSEIEQLSEFEQSRERTSEKAEVRSRLCSNSEITFGNNQAIVEFKFSKPGLQSSIQDNGRSGHQKFGVPIGGAMDQKSARIANQLVGNPFGSPVLEISLLGPKIEISGACQIAITGADLSPKIDGKSIPMWETISITNPAVLSFGKNISGSRSYLAFRGSWNLKNWLGSFSAATSNGKDLTPKSIIEKNDLLTGHAQPFQSKKIYPEKYRPKFRSSLKVRILTGPEFDFFTKKEIDFFTKTNFNISNEANRMGFRLSQKFPDFKPKSEIISSGIVPGTIQITNAGQPIILMRDAQTTGGYPRIANILSEDLDRMAQMKPGDEISFELVSLTA